MPAIDHFLHPWDLDAESLGVEEIRYFTYGTVLILEGRAHEARIKTRARGS